MWSGMLYFSWQVLEKDKGKILVKWLLASCIDMTQNSTQITAMAILELKAEKKQLVTEN